MQARQDPSALLDSILHLRSSPLFATFPAAELAPLAYHAREVRFPRGTIVAHRAEISNQFCHVFEGTVRTSTGQVQGIREALGGLALFAGTGMPFEVVAEDEVRASVIRGDAVFEALEDNSQILHLLAHSLSVQLLKEREKLGGAESVLDRSLAGLSVDDGTFDLVQKMLLIQHAQGLRRTSATALADAARNMRPLRVPKGQFLWRRGDLATHGLIIISGTISAMSPDRLPIRLGPKIAIGALEVLAEVPRRFDLLAEEDVWGLESSFSRFFEAFEDHFQMATDILATLARETLNALCPACAA